MPKTKRKEEESGDTTSGVEKRAKTDNVGDEDDLSHLDMSTRDKRVPLFNYGNLRGMPKGHAKIIIDAIEKAYPGSKSKIDTKKFKKDDDVCFEMAVLDEGTCTIAILEYKKYMKQRQEQVDKIPKGEKQYYMPGVKCANVQPPEEDESAYDEPISVLTCKDCIVAYRNGEERNGYCYGCSIMVCSLCSKMCVTCNVRWCEKCINEQGDYDEPCCTAMHFSQLDYARRYWGSDEYDSDDMESTWWGNEKANF